MSIMKELHISIQEMLDEGFAPKTVGRVLEVPTSWVYEVVEQQTRDAVDHDEPELFSPYETCNS